ncbi:YTH domain-containing protein [Dirofilaria immitis]
MAEIKDETICDSSDSFSGGEHDSNDNNNGKDKQNNSESIKESHGSNKLRYCPAQVVNNDDVVVVVEEHSDQLDEGDVDLDLIVRDECDETHEETLEPPRCNSVPVIKNENTSTCKRAHSTESYKYKRPDAVICGESVEIECLMHRAQFFLARACEENIKLAMKTSLWTTHPFVEKLLAEAYRRAPVVILVFLARNADYFAGFARMCSEALYRSQPAMKWVDFKGGGNIKLQWITKCPLALSASDHIKNPFNKEKVIYAAADGCEIQRAAGQRLCSLFPFDDSVDLKALKTKIRNNSQKLPSLLESEISYLEFRNAKRNLPIKKTLKDLLSQKRPPAVMLSSSGHGSRNKKSSGAENYGASRLLPLMDVAVPYPSYSNARFSSCLRKRHASPKRLSPRRRPLIRSHRHRSKSSERIKRHSLERSSGQKYDSYSTRGSSKSGWHGNSHEEQQLFRRHSNRHRC